jgi:hypothetical protein
LLFRKARTASTNASSVKAGKTLQQAAVKIPEAMNKSIVNLNAKVGSNESVNGSWGSGVVHFLFLVTNSLPHSDIWREFFANAPHGSWKALVHCKDPHSCVSNGVFYDNPGFMQVATTPTWYCHDLVTAMRLLLDSALKLQATGHTGGREKFVFVSDTTLPVKPFSEVHSTLLYDDNSDFCVFPSDQWASGSIDGTIVKLVKHHQWVILNRQHAQDFVNSWWPVDSQSNWRVYLKDGHWANSGRYVGPKNFYYPPQANTCTDEWAFMATIYGAMPMSTGVTSLHGFGGVSLDMQSHTTQGQCRTWSYWDNTWDPASSALASQIANDFYGSQISCYPKCYARPAQLERLSANSLYALRKSPFLFARKFSPLLYMPNYYDIVLRY